MIESAGEFVRLRTSQIPEEYNRAAHDEASEAVWLELVERHPEMREWVAHNKTVPLEILRRLAIDQDVRVRWTVAGKRKLDEVLFAQLARDEDETVRYRIAVNAKTPRHIREALTRDPAALVADAARERL
jgi:hypothetical protein